MCKCSFLKLLYLQVLRNMQKDIQIACQPTHFFSFCCYPVLFAKQCCNSTVPGCIKTNQSVTLVFDKVTLGEQRILCHNLTVSHMHNDLRESCNLIGYPGPHHTVHRQMEGCPGQKMTLARQSCHGRQAAVTTPPPGFLLVGGYVHGFAVGLVFHSIQ